MGRVRENQSLADCKAATRVSSNTNPSPHLTSLPTPVEYCSGLVVKFCGNEESLLASQLHGSLGEQLEIMSW